VTQDAIIYPEFSDAKALYGATFPPGKKGVAKPLPAVPTTFPAIVDHCFIAAGHKHDKIHIGDCIIIETLPMGAGAVPTTTACVVLAIELVPESGYEPASSYPCYRLNKLHCQQGSPRPRLRRNRPA